MATEESLWAAREREAFAAALGQGVHRSPKASEKYGKSLRRAVPRDVCAGWVPSPARPETVGLLFEQDERRQPDLVTQRRQAMGASPFAFSCGSALVVASDLSTLPTTGVEVQLCGDAHVSNFGLFRVPGQGLVFDIRDFDETCRGPWEWDVARLVASVEGCGRERRFDDKARARAVLAAAAGYRKGMRSLADKGNLEAWHTRPSAKGLAASLASAATGAKRKKAGTRTPSEPSDGAEPIPAGHLDVVAEVLSKWRKKLPAELAALVGKYRVVGVRRGRASLGTEGLFDYVVFMEGMGPADKLVLQVKEARRSSLESFVGRAPQKSHAQRVVEGQRAMQAASDMLLGWTSATMPDGRERDFYVRQLWDDGRRIDLAAISPRQLRDLAALCGNTLACAHARTGNRHAIASYLGGSERFDKAMLEFAQLYASQNDRDYARYLRAL